MENFFDSSFDFAPARRSVKNAKLRKRRFASLVSNAVAAPLSSLSLFFSAASHRPHPPPTPHRRLSRGRGTTASTRTHALTDTEPRQPCDDHRSRTNVFWCVHIAERTILSGGPVRGLIVKRANGVAHVGGRFCVAEPSAAAAAAARHSDRPETESITGADRRSRLDANIQDIRYSVRNNLHSPPHHPKTGGWIGLDGQQIRQISSSNSPSRCCSSGLDGICPLTQRGVGLAINNSDPVLSFLRIGALSF